MTNGENVGSQFVNGNLVFNDSLTGAALLTIAPAGVQIGAIKGTSYYVNGSTGSDTLNNGLSWASPLLTIAAAVALAVAGDTIYIYGTAFSEAVTCSVAGVRFIGVGTGPAQATWTAPTVAGSWCLKLNAAYCSVFNIKIKPVIYTSSGVPSGIFLTSVASYTRIVGNRFQGQAGSYTAIYNDTPCDNVEISENEFLSMNTLSQGKAIYGVDNSGVTAHSAWKIKNNTFNSCVQDINITGRTCLLEGNKHFINGLAADGTFGSAVTTKAIDLSGTGSGANVVTKNTLGGTYGLTLYTPGATGDIWNGNYTGIVSTYAPYGLTVDVPH